MARQIGDIIITGTIDDITFYEMDGKGYARHKSSLTGKRVKRDPRFKRTMQSAHRLGRGSQLASKVYRSLPKTEQVYNLFKELKRIAILAIKEGKGEAEVMMLLQQQVGQNRGIKKSPAVITPPQLPGASGQIKKTPRLLRVFGGRVKDVKGPRSERKRLLRAACHSRIAQWDQQQRE